MNIPICMSLFVLYTLALPFFKSQRQMHMAASRRQARQQSASFDVILPDLTPLLDVITNGCKSMDSNLTDLVTAASAEITEIITAVTDLEVKDITNAINDGNNVYATGLTEIFHQATEEITQLMAAITGSEVEGTTKMLQKNADNLKITIQQLIDAANTKIEEIVNAHTSREHNLLAEMIILQNQTIYTQIEKILGDPLNTAPIIPQLTFPDPAKIANSIVPGKTALNEELKNTIAELFAHIQAAIKQTQDLEMGAQKDIMSKGTTGYVEQLNAIRNNTLVNVQKETNDISAGVLTTILESLTDKNHIMKNDIVNVVNKINEEANAVITETTQLEITDLAPLIADYNKNIATQIIPVLTPVR